MIRQTIFIFGVLIGTVFSCTPKDNSGTLDPVESFRCVTVDPWRYCAPSDHYPQSADVRPWVQSRIALLTENQGNANNLALGSIKNGSGKTITDKDEFDDVESEDLSPLSIALPKQSPDVPAVRTRRMGPGNWAADKRWNELSANAEMEIGRGGFARVRAIGDHLVLKDIEVDKRLETWFPAIETMAKIPGARRMFSFPLEVLVESHPSSPTGDPPPPRVRIVEHRFTPFSQVAIRKLWGFGLANDWSHSLIPSVEQLHHAGIIHRDIKPDNLLFPLGSTDFRKPRLTDWGTAAQKSDYDRPDARDPGDIGTPIYRYYGGDGLSKKELAWDRQRRRDRYAAALTILQVAVPNEVFRTMMSSLGPYPGLKDFTVSEAEALEGIGHKLFPPGIASPQSAALMTKLINWVDPTFLMRPK